MFLGLRPKGECPIVDVFGDFVFFWGPEGTKWPRGLYATDFAEGVCFFFAWHFRNKFSFEAYISVTIEDTPMGFGIPFNNFARNIFAEKNFRKSFGNLGFFSKNVQNPTSFTWAESSIGANSPSQGPHWYTNAYSERPLGYGLPSSCVFVRQVFL